MKAKLKKLQEREEEQLKEDKTQAETQLPVDEPQMIQLVDPDDTDFNIHGAKQLLDPNTDYNTEAGNQRLLK